METKKGVIKTKNGAIKTKKGVIQATKFPVSLFMPYLFFYAGQAIYGTYLNLYFNDIGFTKTQMGSFTSIATLIVLLVQPLWGYASDRTKNKNRILSLLILGCGTTILGFYLGINYYYILLLNCAFSVFYTSSPALMDNLTLESLEKRESRFDFGHIRLGGTLGYAIGVLAAGRIMSDNYKKMFYMISILMFLAFIAIRFIAPVAGHRSKEKTSFKSLIKDKKIFCFILVNFIFSLGMTIYYSFYPLYFTSIGGDSAQIGLLMFATAASEIPFWLITGKLVNKLGYEKMIVISIAVTGFRWLALFFVTNPLLAIAVNLTHGFCFVTLNYSIITYINAHVPKDLRATGQSMNNLLTTIFSRVIGGVLVGYLSDKFGINQMLLISSVLAFAGSIIFPIAFTAIKRSEAKNALVS
jgi:PPP family 3-phenylpropionic acid transporter